MMAEWDIEFAKIFRERDNPSNLGVIIGKVIKPLPELEISILNESAILDKDDLYICNSLLDTYTREFQKEGSIKFKDSGCGTTTTVNDGGYQASSHNHEIENLNIDTQYTAEGKITFVDTLKMDDEVLLVPEATEQIFFIIDKIKKVGDL